MKWEYMMVRLADGGIVEKLNELGAEGWEVFLIEKGNVTGHTHTLFLKRRAK